MKKTPFEAYADTVAEVIGDIYERSDMDQEEGANRRLLTAGDQLRRQILGKIEMALPAKTSLADGPGKPSELVRGKIEIIDLVRKAIKEVKSA